MPVAALDIVSVNLDWSSSKSMGMLYTRYTSIRFILWVFASRFLVSSARDPSTYYAGLAKQTVKESPKEFTRLIVERCEVSKSNWWVTFNALAVGTKSNVAYEIEIFLLVGNID